MNGKIPTESLSKATAYCATLDKGSAPVAPPLPPHLLAKGKTSRSYLSQASSHTTTAATAGTGCTTDLACYQSNSRTPVCCGTCLSKSKFLSAVALQDTATLGKCLTEVTTKTSETFPLPSPETTASKAAYAAAIFDAVDAYQAMTEVADPAKTIKKGTTTCRKLVKKVGKAGESNAVQRFEAAQSCTTAITASKIFTKREDAVNKAAVAAAEVAEAAKREWQPPEKLVQLLEEEADVTREEAVEALRRHEGDVVKALQELL